MKFYVQFTARNKRGATMTSGYVVETKTKDWNSAADAAYDRAAESGLTDIKIISIKLSK